MFLKQIEVSPMAVFDYIIGDPQTGKGLVIDPADNIDFLIGLAKDHDIRLDYIVNTHGHIDHISGNKEMKDKTGAAIIVHELDAPMLINTPSSMLRMFNAKPSPAADQTVKDGDLIILGNISLKVIHTPGHTPGSIVLQLDDCVFTGDTLFVEAIGRTDLPGGSWPVMFRSIKERIFTLPDETKVFPGHNYGRMPSSTVGHEKKYNPYIQ
ncbi:MAG: MBL fold metallo-hydrolase [Syntrophobacterales bacterium]|jgi:glyoxylase-like metal-dependent hydrolase (beta-lactamase superfamily II)|nr:MBL fold metallo-hydrolase [Syntrophobacterales bacterium]